MHNHQPITFKRRASQNSQENIYTDVCICGATRVSTVSNNNKFKWFFGVWKEKEPEYKSIVAIKDGIMTRICKR